MPSKTNLELLHGDDDMPDPPGRIGLAIEALRARVVEEFQISERLDSKGRQVFALAAAFFAVAQTVAFGSFRVAQVTGAERVGIATLGLCAAVALLVTGHRLANSEEPQSEQDIGPSKIEEWARTVDDNEFGRLLIVHLREIADRRTASNKRRVARYRMIESMARVALVLTGTEIIFAVASRL